MHWWLKILTGMCAFSASGCAVVINENSNHTRDYYIVGIARVRVPQPGSTEHTVQSVEVSGVGVAVSHYLQLGYFKEFQASLTPDSNSAVVVLRSDAEARQLESLLQQLNKDGLCLIIKDQRR